MRITIGISAYNQQEFLCDAIESALNQTIPCEVIVVNDGSPDNTREIAERYPVKLINQVNKGLASARNTAIMNMEGTHFLPLDSDDLLLENCAEEILKLATIADIAAPSFKEFGVSQRDVILMENPTLDDFKLGNRIGYFSAIKREALLECGGYSQRMQEGYEDYHLWIDLLSRGKKIVTIPTPLVLYRTKKESMYTEALKHHDKLMAQIKKDFPHVYA